MVASENTSSLPQYGLAILFLLIIHFYQLPYNSFNNGKTTVDNYKKILPKQLSYYFINVCIKSKLYILTSLS